MNGTNTAVVRIDQSGPVHISEVISQLLPRYVEPSTFSKTMIGHDEPTRANSEEWMPRRTLSNFPTI